MQLTRLEIKRRNLDAENLQVGVIAFFLCPHLLDFSLLPVGYYIIYFHTIAPWQQLIIVQVQENNEK